MVCLLYLLLLLHFRFNKLDDAFMLSADITLLSLYLFMLLFMMSFICDLLSVSVVMLCAW